MQERFEHVSVLLRESLEALAIRPDGIYLDGTFGRGGHARAILDSLGEDGRLLATDKDPAAVREGRRLLGADPRFELEQGSFTMLETLAEKHGWLGRVNGILLDLGVSSPQLDDPARGFSFRGEGPLDMRMDPERGESAADWLAQADDKAIARVLREYGEERFAGRIARAIVRARETEGPIRTTGRLAEVVARANPSWEKGKDPATRTFQAIRIHINEELQELDRCLASVPRILAPGGRMAVISFHSLEDRRVKQFIRKEARGDEFPPDLPIAADRLNPRMRAVGKAVRPGPEEVGANPRARSAVLRVAERV